MSGASLSANARRRACLADLQIMMPVGLRRALWLLGVAIALCDASIDEHVVYVSAAHAASNGSDDGAAAARAAAADGSPGAPFPTIEAARDHLRALRGDGAQDGDRRYRVIIGAGTYPPLQLERQDSGSPRSPVVYEADSSRGPVVVSAGIQIAKSAFQPWEGHPGVLKANLSQLGVDYGSITAGGDCGGNCTGFAKAGLVFANLSMVLARWPNVDATTGKYAWKRVKIGGPNGFIIRDDPAVVARMRIFFLSNSLIFCPCKLMDLDHGNLSKCLAFA